MTVSYVCTSRLSGIATTFIIAQWDPKASILHSTLMFGVNKAFSGPSVHTHELHLLSHKITVLSQGTFLDGVKNLRLDHIVFGEKSGPKPILFLTLGHPE